MTNSISATAIPAFIQTLLEQRQQHTDSISEIDATLAKVTVALGGTAAAPAAAPKPAAKAPVAAAPATKAIKAGRGKFAISATDLVVKFIGANKNPTTKEITQYLLSEGRSLGAVSNALSVLTKSKTLKRTPLGKGLMGSRYSLA